MKLFHELVIAAAIGCLALAGTAAAQEPPYPPEQAQPPAGQDQPVVRVEIQPGDWQALAGAPADALAAARQSLQQQDPERAAQSIRQAAAFARLEASRARGKTRSQLDRTARELESVATEVEQGRIESVEQLDPHLASAAHAFAAHHQEMARQDWARRDTRAAGHQLRAAADYVGRGAKWAGGMVSDVTRTVVGDAMQVAGKLVEGVGVVPREVGRTVQALGSEVDKLGRRVRGVPSEKAQPQQPMEEPIPQPTEPTEEPIPDVYPPEQPQPQPQRPMP